MISSKSSSTFGETKLRIVFHPSGKAYRLILLLVVCFMIYGSYFAYDSVGAIEDYLMDKMKIGQQQIGLMYSMYSWGAIATLLISGWLIDRLGTRASSMIFSAVVTLGSVIVAVSPSLLGIHTGRLIFGAGSEALIVAQSAILARWFKGRELAFAFGAAITMGRLGTLFSFNTEALIAQKIGAAGALWVAAGLCGASLVANLIYVLMDKRGEQFVSMPTPATAEKLVLKDVFQLGRLYWYLTFICLFFYSSIFPFTALSTNFFHEKWNLPLSVDKGSSFVGSAFANFLHMTSTAPGTTSIIVFASLVFAPLAGALIDRIGKRLWFMLIGSLLAIPSFLVLGFSGLSPLFAMVLLGAGFVLLPAALWPSVPLVVEGERLGTAYGLMTLIQNIGLMLFPWLNGFLREKTHSYTSSMVMFASLCALAAILSADLVRRKKPSL